MSIEQHLIELDRLRKQSARDAAEYLAVREREIHKDQIIAQLAAVARGLLRYIDSTPPQPKQSPSNRPPLRDWDQ